MIRFNKIVRSQGILIEALIDHVHPDIAPQIKLAKDVAAGAVLIASLGSLAIGVLMILDALSR